MECAIDVLLQPSISMPKSLVLSCMPSLEAAKYCVSKHVMRPNCRFVAHSSDKIWKLWFFKLSVLKVGSPRIWNHEQLILEGLPEVLWNVCFVWIREWIHLEPNSLKSLLAIMWGWRNICIFFGFVMFYQSLYATVDPEASKVMCVQAFQIIWNGRSTSLFCLSFQIKISARSTLPAIILLTIAPTSQPPQSNFLNATHSVLEKGKRKTANGLPAST